MKNKTLAILGIGTYILSVLSSATDLSGNSTAPMALIAVSAIATLVFVIMATIRLWGEAKGVSIALVSSAVILFVLSLTQGDIVLLNITKAVNFIAFIWAIIKLFKMASVNVASQKTMSEKLYNDNPDMAMRIATGEEKAPNGILAAAVYAKVCSEAEKSDNLDMMMRIANSLHNTEISAESQNLKFRSPDSAIEKMKELVNARREAFEKREGRTVKSAVQEEVENIKKAMDESKPTEKDFEDSLGGDKK